jgi:RNA polymerase sigma factor (sigma-70 family)
MHAILTTRAQCLRIGSCQRRMFALASGNCQSRHERFLVHSWSKQSERDRLTLEAISGDRDALLQLLELVEPDIRRFARAHCSASDAEDAAQEALWQLFRRVGMLRAASALPGWLFTTVRRECLRLARAAFRHQSSIEDFDETRFLHQTPAELRLDVARAIDALPRHYREIIVLRDFQQMTVNEIGERLDLTREAVKGRLLRSRALLREHLLQY